MIRLVFMICLCCISLLFSQERKVEISNKIDSLLHVIDPKGPGVTLGVFKDGVLYSHHTGMANLEYNVPFNKETVFGLASITKQITAACIGVLEYNKRLNVEDDVRKYIPELPVYGEAIKIKHLLNHTSGIRNHNVLLNLQGFDYEHSGYTNKSVQKLIFKQKGVNHIPGDKMLYSNSNYVLLALIIERVSGMTLPAYAKKELFEPLGLAQTFYKAYLAQIIKNRAYSYYKENGVFKQPKSLTLCIGAGGAGSTINDMLKWSQLFLNKNSKLSYLNSFLTTVGSLNNGVQMQYARGVFVSSYKNFKTINHSGRDVGMRSQLICLPDENLSVVIFSNSEAINVVNLSYKIIDLFVEGSKEQKAKENKYSHSLDELNRYAGHYQELNSDLGMKITVDGSSLKAKSSFGKQLVPLKESTQSTFKRVDNESVSYRFFDIGAFEYDLIVDFGGAKFYFEKVQLAQSENFVVTDFVGDYFSKELEVHYRLYTENNRLYLSYPNNLKLELFLGQKDEFGARNRTRYIFNRDKYNNIDSFSVASEGTVKDILFQKVKSINAKKKL